MYVVIYMIYIKYILNKCKYCQKLWRDWVLPHLQSNSLACHTPIETDRKHRSAGSEMNDSLLRTTECTCAGFQASVSLGQHEKSQVTLAHTVSYITGEEPRTWGAWMFYNWQ